MLIHWIVGILGFVLVLVAVFSAIRTFLVPRGVPDQLTRSVFVSMRYIFDLPFPGSREQRLAFFAPISLLTLPIVWLTSLLFGYTGIYWALGAPTWHAAFTISRYSLLYLGSNPHGLAGATEFAFSETVLSLLLAAVLVSYLPTMYSAFSQREANVTGLETRAGSPPTPAGMLKRFYIIKGLDQLPEVWLSWQAWFEVVEETHTALQPLVFYRSPQPDRSWVTAAGAVLDSAAITASTLERPRDPEAELCIRAGYLCLRRISQSFGIPYDPDPAPTDPISVSQEEYDAVYDQLAAVGIPVKADREQAWQDFRGWRVNYDAPLIGLAVLTAAPPAPWSSDRFQVRPHAAALYQARRAATLALAGQLSPAQE